MKRIIKMIKEFITYDRVYYEGRLFSLVVAITCFILMLLLMLLRYLMEV